MERKFLKREGWNAIYSADNGIIVEPIVFRIWRKLAQVGLTYLAFLVIIYPAFHVPAALDSVIMTISSFGLFFTFTTALLLKFIGFFQAHSGKMMEKRQARAEEIYENGEY